MYTSGLDQWTWAGCLHCVLTDAGCPLEEMSWNREVEGGGVEERRLCRTREGGQNRAVMGSVTRADQDWEGWDQWWQCTWDPYLLPGPDLPSWINADLCYWLSWWRAGKNNSAARAYLGQGDKYGCWGLSWSKETSISFCMGCSRSWAYSIALLRRSLDGIGLIKMGLDGTVR